MSFKQGYRFGEAIAGAIGKAIGGIGGLFRLLFSGGAKAKNYSLSREVREL